MEEFEEDIVSLYVDGVDNKERELCTKISYICENYDDEDDSDNSDNNVDTDFYLDRDEL